MKKTQDMSLIVCDESLAEFSKGKQRKSIIENIAVMYTRVSSKDQADHNHSLETQNRQIEEFSERTHIPIEARFGGTHESAKTDDRREFKRMLDYVRKYKHITHIFIATLDRFSRSGGGAIKLAEDLQKRGVSIVAVTQAADTTTPAGQLLQQIGFVFSNYDNRLRKQKCSDGLRDALLRGQACSSIPFGYEKGIVNGEPVRVITDKGRILKNAFIWKAEEGLTNEKIADRLAQHGLIVKRQHLSTIFRNPYYCGLLVHSLLEGKIVKGNHEPLISVELFKRVNRILDKSPQGWKHKCAHNELPLKGLLKCPKCDRIVTGYIAKKKQLWYYKCRNKGCKVNISANRVNETFIGVLNSFELKPAYQALFEELLTRELGAEVTTAQNQVKTLNIRLAELKEQRENLEYRYALGKVEEPIFRKYDTILATDIRSAAMELEKVKEKSSNLKNDAKNALQFATKLSNSWLSSEYFKKQQLQKLIFPRGIVYSKENHTVRTEKINDMFLWIARYQQNTEENRVGITQANLSYADLVDPQGVEPWSK